jgi:hypothetical protein
VLTAGHEPALQFAAAVAVPLVQLAPRHCDVGYAQELALLPSQLPPQEEPSLAQAERAPCGAPLTVVHLPTLPATSQAWHWLPQAELQQTPSTQLLLAHWFDALHTVPSASLATQTCAALQ